MTESTEKTPSNPAETRTSGGVGLSSDALLGKRVYIVIAGDDYEEKRIVGVYATKEGAEQAMGKCWKENKRWMTTNDAEDTYDPWACLSDYNTQEFIIFA